MHLLFKSELWDSAELGWNFFQDNYIAIYWSAAVKTREPQTVECKGNLNYNVFCKLYQK